MTFRIFVPTDARTRRMATTTPDALARRAATTLRTRLEPTARLARQVADEAKEDVDAWDELLEKLETIGTGGGDGFDALVDVGGEIRARARVRDASKVYVDVGLGFKAEMTVEEARTCARRRREEAKRDFSTKEREAVEAAEVADEVRSALRAMLGMSTEAA